MGGSLKPKSTRAIRAEIKKLRTYVKTPMKGRPESADYWESLTISSAIQALDWIQNNRLPVSDTVQWGRDLSREHAKKTKKRKPKNG